MPVIWLRTIINAPIERAFDLSRSIEFHQESTSGTRERAVDGRIVGLIELGEQVTWEARHFCVRQRLTTKITKLDRPWYFQDVMLRGAFKHMIHDHIFEQAQATSESPEHTMMTDRFEFSAPFGYLGTLAERLVLTDYLRRFLERRNRHLKQTAESVDDWRRYLGNPTR